MKNLMMEDEKQISVSSYGRKLDKRKTRYSLMGKYKIADKIIFGKYTRERCDLPALSPVYTRERQNIGKSLCLWV